MGWKKTCNEKNLGEIGFRELHLFNMALLAKQGWKLLTGQSSLLFRVLKARYFPTSTFLNAKFSSNASYTWRSIMRARDVLQLVFRWKIVNGSQIKISEDQWLPKRNTLKVISPKPHQAPYNFVCDLIDENTKTWKRDLIDTS